MRPNDIKVGVTYTGCNKYGMYKQNPSPTQSRLVLDFIPSQSGYLPRETAVKWLRYVDIKSGKVKECRLDSFASWATSSEGEVVECEKEIDRKVKLVKILLQELKPEQLKEVLEPYGLLQT